MKNIILINSLIVLLAFVSCSQQKTNSTDSKKYPEEQLDWKLGAQAYTFNRFTLLDAVSKIDSCSLRYVEGYPGQEIGGGIDGKFDFRMDQLRQQKLLEALKSKGVKLVAYGVVVDGNSEADWQQLFEFCKGMGIETITSEPNVKDIPLLSELCDKYQINVAIHNHPEPTYYWHPDSILNNIKGYSSRIGACADIGHWVRSGLDPVDCLKKLEGHVLQLHMKDLNELNNKEAHDVHWGKGVCNVQAVIRELERQQFKGMISTEYEYNWENNTPDVAASISFFREQL